MNRRYLLFLVILLTAIHGKAQAPGHVPYGEPEQLELTPANILFLIVLPILFFVALIIIRRRKKNKKKF